MKYFSLIIAAIALVGCGDSSNKIFGKWKQGNDVIEFTKDTVTVVGIPQQIDRYEMKDGQVTVFLKQNPMALVFSFKSDSEICSEMKLVIDGCFKKMG